MEFVKTPFSNVPASRLGMGCSYLTGGLEMNKSRRLIDAAIDCGVNYFDVAPPYGIGTAEDVIGLATKTRRSKMILASKVGLPRPSLSRGTQVLRLISTPVRPMLRKKWAAGAGAGVAKTSLMDPALVEKSVDDSLRRLKTDYLDLLLLHEAQSDSVSDEVLLLLDKMRASGRLGAIGAATDVANTRRLHARCPGFFNVAQFGWSALDFDVNPDEFAFSIIYRALLDIASPLRNWLRRDPGMRCLFADRLAVDVDDEPALSNLLLAAAFAANTKGIVLVGSRREDRIRANASIVDNQPLLIAGRRLLQIMREEGPAFRALSKAAAT